MFSPILFGNLHKNLNTNWTLLNFFLNTTILLKEFNIFFFKAISVSYQLILEDLSEIESIDPIVSPIPYDDSTPIPARIPMIF